MKKNEVCLKEYLCEKLVVLCANSNKHEVSNVEELIKEISSDDKTIDEVKKICNKAVQSKLNSYSKYIAASTNFYRYLITTMSSTKVNASFFII